MNIEPHIQSRARFPMQRPVVELRDVSRPAHANVVEWQQSLGLARQACARIFRDGGTASDALKVFGLEPAADADWSRAVEAIARLLSSPAGRRSM